MLYEVITAYGVSKRAIELEGRGIQSGFDLQDVKLTVQKYESDLFRQTFEELKDFQSRVLQLLVDAGALSQEQVQNIQALNNEYIPFKRSFDRGEFNQAFGIGGGKSIADTGQGISKIKGSGT